MITYELPAPEGWREIWRVVYTPLDGGQVHVDAGRHSAISGKLEDLPVADPTSALWIDYRGKGYTFRWHFTRRSDGSWEAGQYNGEPLKRWSSKYRDPMAPTYARKVAEAVLAALESEYQAHPERWATAERERQGNELQRLTRDYEEARSALQRAELALETFRAAHRSGQPD